MGGNCEGIRRWAGRGEGAKPFVTGKRLPCRLVAHRSGRDLTADFVARWLREVDGWDDESAHNLSIQFEFAQDGPPGLRRRAAAVTAMSPQDVARIASLGLPVLCTDTCSVLDIMRDPTRDSARAHERALPRRRF
jgi:hypothetical protein